jgi:hypothetical protein
MARLKLELDQPTFQRLLETALGERRPVVWQAEVMLRQALGLPFPYPANTTDAPSRMTANNVDTTE